MAVTYAAPAARTLPATSTGSTASAVSLMPTGIFTASATTFVTIAAASGSAPSSWPLL